LGVVAMTSFQKIKTPRSPKYLAWIRTQPCCATDCPPSDYCQIVAHHVRSGNGGGIGMKVSDYRTIPLRADIHNELHGYCSEKQWYADFLDVHWDEMVLRYMLKYALEIDESKNAMRALEQMLVEL